MLVARGDLVPITAAQLAAAKPGSITGAGWVRWWQLVASVAGACRRLRTALLGPAASELWAWTYIKSSYRLSSSDELFVARTRSMRSLPGRQAGHARSALIRGCGSQAADLQAAVVTLTNVSELTLWGMYSSHDTRTIVGALCSSQLSRVWYQGVQSLPVSAAFQGLQHLSLSLHTCPVAAALELARWLPDLQSLELAMRSDCDLEVCLHQLAGAKMHTLRVRYMLPLSLHVYQLAARLEISQLVLCGLLPHWQLQHMPHGLKVVCEPLD